MECSAKAGKPWARLMCMSPGKRALCCLAPTNKIQMNSASVWVLGLKLNRAKLSELVRDIAGLPGLMQADGFEVLPITAAHRLRT